MKDVDKIKNLTRDISSISEMQSSIILSFDNLKTQSISIVGKRFCFSGPCVSECRDHIMEKLKKMGAGVSTKLDERVSYLVVDDIGLSSNKMKEAEKLKIRKISSLDITSNKEYASFGRNITSEEKKAMEEITLEDV